MADDVKRLNYFNGQFLRETDFNDEQGYHVRHQRDHARLLHTPGIAEGLDVPTPPTGATAITVNAGVAYDDQGRRIVLADNQPLELVGLPPGQQVYVTIAYRETQTDPTDETGISAKMRWTEAPLIETAAGAPANPNAQLVLALIQRTGTTIGAVDRGARRVAGVKVGGDLDVRSVRFTSGDVAETGWVRTALHPDGTLHVAGHLTVEGTIRGDIAIGTVQAGDLQDNAVVSAKLAEADGTSGQNANTGSGVKTAHIQDGAVTGAKLANLAVGTARLADTSVTTAKLVDGAIGTTKLADGAVTLQKLAPAAQAIASIEGVSSPGGPIDLVPGGAITIVGDNVGKRIAISETHSGLTGNPHGTTAAQVGALATTGGAISGNVLLGGNVIVGGTLSVIGNRVDPIATPIAGGTPLGGNVGVGTTDPQIKVYVAGDIRLQSGTAVNEFSTDQTLSDNSDSAVPTERAVKEYIDNLLAGSVTAFAMVVPPAGWLECKGQALSRAVYARLFSRIGTTFGAGDGATTFNLPALGGIAIKGWDSGKIGTADPKFGDYQLGAFENHRHGIPGAVGNTSTIGTHAHFAISILTTGENEHSHTYQIGDFAAPSWAGADQSRRSASNLLFCIKY